eukprot:2706772-Lingulodinium_polyedra.AAC.1
MFAGAIAFVARDIVPLSHQFRDYDLQAAGHCANRRNGETQQPEGGSGMCGKGAPVPGARHRPGGHE